MKVALIILLWLGGYLLTLFLFMLLSRLLGDDPDSVYSFDNENAIIYLGCIVFWPLGLVIEIPVLIFLKLRKWFVLVIETIVAVKESKDEESED